jgi:ParB family chromosome partitioning protein
LKTKSRLGRGLSSLISVEIPPDAPPAEPAALRPSAAALPARAPADVTLPSGGVAEISLDAIVPNPHQPRRQMNDASIAELAASLKSTGVIQPIIVRKNGDRFELIAGERRWRAAKLAGLSNVPAIVREVTGFEQAQMALVENIQRENLNPIDRALAYKALMSQLGLTQAEIASRMGEDRSSIANHLRLLDLPQPVQAMIGDGRLTLGHAKVLAGVSDPLEQERLANLVVNQNLSVRNLERQLQETKPPAPERAKPTSTAHYQDLEKSISQQLGLRVQLRAGAKKGKGRVILHYGTLDQFDQLLSRLGVALNE